MSCHSAGSLFTWQLVVRVLIGTFTVSVVTTVTARQNTAATRKQDDEAALSARNHDRGKR
jgi:hypothetical protein